MLLVVLVAGGVGLVVLDGVARGAAESAAAVQARTELGLQRAPLVRIGGRSFLWQVARGRYPDVSLAAPALTEQGTTLHDVRVRARDVTLPLAVAVGRGGTVHVGGGSVRAVLPWADAARRASAATGLPLRLRAADRDVAATTTLQVLGRDVRVSVTMAPALDGGQLELRPRTATVAGHRVPLDGLRRTLRAVGRDDLADPVRLPLDGLPDGVRPTALRVAPDGVVVDADLAPTTVQVPSAS